LAAAAILLTGCASNTPTDSDSSADTASTDAAEGEATDAAPAPILLEEGALTVCTMLGSQPWIFRDDTSGEVVGFDMDMVNLVATYLGIEMKTVLADFPQIAAGAVYGAKMCDISAAAITVTEARKEAMTFADPYFDTYQALLVKADSTITDLADMDGLIVAVQTDSTGQIYAQDHAEEYGYDVKIFDDMPSTANAVLAGTADAALWDNAGLIPYVQQNPDDVKIVADYDTGEHYAWAMALDNPGLLAAANEALAKARADGTYDAIYDEWLGSETGE
jgi:polar amino acid transport system substrate-binding protein